MVSRSPESLLRIIPVSLSVAELAELEDHIEAGHLPKDYIEQYFDKMDAAVFGEDAEKDRKGNRKEQGLGSAVNQTQQSIDAYKRWCGPGKPLEEPKEVYEAALARMLKELVASNARRQAEAERTRKTAKRRFVV